MPFADEIPFDGVEVIPYRASWLAAFQKYRDELAGVLGPLENAIDHIGSTAIPGMASKDCVDIQVRMRDPLEPEVENLMCRAGFRKRPEPWNCIEVSWGQENKKQVYAPAVGRRPCNIHFRAFGSASATYALLFRDYLTAHPVARDGWSEFKQLLAQAVPDMSRYGTVKQPATRILMEGALCWAKANGWTPDR